MNTYMKQLSLLLVAMLMAMVAVGCTKDDPVEETVQQDHRIAEEVEVTEDELEEDTSENEKGEMVESKEEEVSVEQRKEHWLYYADLKEGPAIIFQDSARFGHANRELSDIEGVADDIPGQIALLELNPTDKYFDTFYAEDTGTLFFTILNEDRATELYMYKTGEVTQFFSSDQVIEGGAYTFYKDIIEDQYIAFTAIPCYECGPPYPETLLLDVKSGEQIRVGKTVDIEWKNTNGEFRYLPYVTESCEYSFTGFCTVDEELIDWTDGSFSTFDRSHNIASFVSTEYGFSYDYPEQYTNRKTWSDDMEGNDALKHRILSPEDIELLRQRDDITHDGFGTTVRVVNSDLSAKEYCPSGIDESTSECGLYAAQHTEFLHYHAEELGDGKDYYVAELGGGEILVVSADFLNVNNSPELRDILDSIQINN